MCVRVRVFGMPRLVKRSHCRVRSRTSPGTEPKKRELLSISFSDCFRLVVLPTKNERLSRQARDKREETLKHRPFCAAPTAAGWDWRCAHCPMLPSLSHTARFTPPLSLVAAFSPYGRRVLTLKYIYIGLAYTLLAHQPAEQHTVPLPPASCSDRDAALHAPAVGASTAGGGGAAAASNHAPDGAATTTTSTTDAATTTSASGSGSGSASAVEGSSCSGLLLLQWAAEPTAQWVKGRWKVTIP
eukprot:COSAG06_NODE_889_length_11746_cov_48.163733_8_plen_243_part_00